MLAVIPASAAANSDTRIIVKRESGLSAAERRDIRADADVRYIEPLPLPQTEVVAARPGDVKDALSDLNADPDVVYAEVDRPIHALSNDAHFAKLWGLQNLGNFSFGSERAVLDADMDVPEAWAHSTGSGRTVAVVDSGVDAGHPDFGDRVVPGWDLVDDDPVANDPNGHGTHVAGTIAATRDNTIGVAGVAPEARIMPLRVLAANGTGSVSDAVVAYDLAADAGVAVVNASMGGEGFVQAEYDVIARHPETLFVVAAGNDGENNDLEAQDPEYPCAYDLDNILCVGASKHDETVASFSNYGPATVDVFAPGYGIYSTVPGGEYDWNDGTSMATPHVAGAAALLAARNPELSTGELKSAIVDSAEVKSAYTGKAVSDGRANANEAMLQLDSDGDGESEADDNCPSVVNPDQTDGDGDGVGDACAPASADADGDSVPVPDDKCPAEPAPYADDGCMSAELWNDGDTVSPAVDNCPAVANPRQENLDGDRLGDDCDPDLDGDATDNAADNCPNASNPDQNDQDADGLGDVCDPDIDGDALDNGEDNCPTVDNPDQENADGDQFGDACEPDTDGDGLLDDVDNCDTVANPGQENADGDAFGDVCEPDSDGDSVLDDADNCDTISNRSQANLDGDATGDACDADDDNDGVADGSDNCPATWNAGQDDADGDRIGDACDGTPRGDDPDGDGRPWIDDACPTVYGTQANGCPVPVAAPQPAQVTRVSAKVTKRGRRRSAKVTISTTGPATVRITVERKKGRRWVRVTRKKRIASGTRATLRVSRLKRGSHRVRISISSGAGAGTSVSKSFRVR